MLRTRIKKMMKKLKEDNVASIPYNYTHKRANNMWARWINIVEFVFDDIAGFRDKRALLEVLEDKDYKQRLKENYFSDEEQRTLRRFLRKAKNNVIL